jgi:hypothetical protein
MCLYLTYDEIYIYSHYFFQEEMEKRLAEDILREANTFGGKVLVHDETGMYQVEPHWLVVQSKHSGGKCSPLYSDDIIGNNAFIARNRDTDCTRNILGCSCLPCTQVNL